ncbi:MAG: chromosomal replication initiator protein DnaA [Actinomycetota bacterium]|nr:chromosomal replication initiator protein DnaA [Actinomycetota bacterium]
MDTRADPGDPGPERPGQSGQSGQSGPLLNPRYTFEAFVTGGSNRFAHAAALAVAEKPAASYNPLFIYGDVGLGKTHLLHGIGHYVHHHYPGMKVRYCTTESFTNEFIESIRSNTQSAFKRRYRRCDVLLIDDIQFLEKQESTQDEFFHTFNALHDDDCQIVLTSDRSPRSFDALEDRLRSRFEWGLVSDVQAPELETRLAILRAKVERERMPISDDILRYIAEKITDNIRELEGALIRLSAYHHLNQEPITLDVAVDELHALVGPKESRQPTAEVIIEAAAEMFGLSADDLRGRSRRRPLVTARQICIYVFRQMTDFSYPAIGREFGGRDHTTIIHAERKVAALMSERRAVFDQVRMLMKRVAAGA